MNALTAAITFVDPANDCLLAMNRDGRIEYMSDRLAGLIQAPRTEGITINAFLSATTASSPARSLMATVAGDIRRVGEVPKAEMIVGNAIWTRLHARVSSELDIWWFDRQPASPRSEMRWLAVLEMLFDGSVLVDTAERLVDARTTETSVELWNAIGMSREAAPSRMIRRAILSRLAASWKSTEGESWFSIVAVPRRDGLVGLYGAPV